MGNRPVIKDVDDNDPVRQHFKQRASEYPLSHGGYYYLSEKRASIAEVLKHKG